MRARHAAVVLAMAMVSVVACNRSPGQSTAASAPSVRPSDDAPPVAASGQPVAVPNCPNYVIKPETGPPPRDMGENHPIVLEQQRLVADIDAAVAYTAEHPDEFGALRIENVPRVRIVVTFTTHLEVHCIALRALLDFPDEFEISWAPRTEANMLSLMDEITAMARGHLTSAAGGETIELSLRADGEALAAEIAAKYGSLVDITVGMLHYPDRRLAAGSSCASLAPSPELGLPLRAEVKLASGEVRSGADFRGTVTVQNVGDQPFDFESGAPQVALVYAGGAVPIGTYVGAIAGVGIGATLQPGGTIPIDVIGGTASCDPALGYAVPPGQVFAVVPVDVYLRPNPNADLQIAKLMSDPVPFRILP